MVELVLRDDEIVSVQRLLDEIAGRFDSVEDPGFLREARLLAHELPRRLRAAIVDFGAEEPASGVLLISGYQVEEERLGPTPASWSLRTVPSPSGREELYLCLLGELLGRPIAWSTQQNGYLVHDILPMKGYEHEQLGSGSEELLWWHTEDAFHQYRGDYLGMMCLRNPDGVATTVGTLDGIRLDPEVVRILFEPHFTIRPDESHLPKNRAPEQEVDGALATSYQGIEQQRQAPEKVAVLFGSREAPYMRLDPFFMDRLSDEPEAQAALDALVRAVDEHLQDLVLRPGDTCFIDNYRAVHGRKPFSARYDGRDRWLKRINVACDLRKSRDKRASAASRLLQ